MAAKTATPAAVLAVIAANDSVMQLLASSVVQHVSMRNPDGPDGRLDTCPCSRGADSVDPAVGGVELGGGQYLSSGRHTLADVVREALGQ